MPVPSPTDTLPQLGTEKRDIETPAVLVDLDVMEDNIKDYAEFAESYDVSLRSHTKTHKIPDLSHYQDRLSGGGGICCQTLSEAEVMAQAGVSDIFLSYNVVGDAKLQRLVRLTDSLDYFATLVDCVEHVAPLQEVAAELDVSVGVILEIDLGLNRTGVVSQEEAVELATTIANASHLSFKGVMGYEANVKSFAESKEGLERLCTEAMDELAEWVETIEDAGVPVTEVKVGSTTTSKFSGKHPIVTEINPGMYIFNDVGEINNRGFEVGKSDCALTVLTTVISKPTPDRAVVDAGSKSISMDKDGRKPIPRYREDVEYVNDSEEHGWLDISAADDIEVGDRLEFIIPHVCTTVNQHDTLVGLRDDMVEKTWNVQARGKVK